MDDIIVEEFLEHFGVKGMKWGVRKDRTPGVSSRVDRDARKDAKEAARAKMFYGEGAGTRRKLIKAKVEAKSKRDANYKKAFDSHISRQDMSKHSSKAVSERRRKNAKDSSTKSAGFVARRLTGEMGTKAAFTSLAIGGAVYLNSPAGRRTLEKTKKIYKDKANAVAISRGARKIEKLLKL